MSTEERIGVICEVYYKVSTVKESDTQNQSKNFSADVFDERLAAIYFSTELFNMVGPTVIYSMNIRDSGSESTNTMMFNKIYNVMDELLIYFLTRTQQIDFNNIVINKFLKANAS